ncbi:hypothetical protein BCUN_0145 [Bifidobacterium cuniculi]|uniref:Membrane associated protein n=2 Tax=Bifidobacterium cuniculi TaxID=1688 RepID=A0A087B3Q0_9BIFI|nr:hypothetical protein BCUN_0145 [Bifidobacterium cuniculi]
MSEHADDLQDVSRSHAARKFEKHAQKEEKRAILSVDDLDSGSFVQGGHGPRDFTGSSWLDTDDVMDRHGGGFRPPRPGLRQGTSTTRIVFGVLAIVGVAGIILAAFLPRLLAFGALFALVALVGAGGLLVTRSPNPHLPDHEDDSADNGARV